MKTNPYIDRCIAINALEQEKMFETFCLLVGSAIQRAESETERNLWEIMHCHMWVHVMWAVPPALALLGKFEHRYHLTPDEREALSKI